jgi:hypothetical protein
MNSTQPPLDSESIQQLLALAHEAQNDQLASVLLPAVEMVETGLSHQIDDLARDTAMGFAEVHGKIEYLRSEILDIKQLLNGLFP